MRKARVIFMVAVVAALAGCADAPRDDDPTVAEPPREPSDEPVVLITDVSLSGCRGVDIALAMAREDAQAMLPENVTPQANRVLPAAATFLLRVWECRGNEASIGAHSGFEAGVVIEPPPVPMVVEEYDRDNRTRREARDRPIDLYLVAAYSDVATWLQIYRQAGVPGGEADATVDAAAAAYAGEVADDDGALLTFEMARLAEGPQSEHRRAWRQSDHGLLLIESDLAPVAGIAEGPVECRLRAGSDAALAVGRTTCREATADARDYDASGRAYWFHDLFFR